jgi:hypothetical protein
MISQAANHILRFLSLLLLQILVLNYVLLKGVFNPYIYIYFILLLPINLTRWQLLLISFAAGFTVDIFSHTLGMHAFTCVLIGYIRPYVLDIVKPSGGYSPEDRPTMGFMGLRWFLSYSIPLIFIFHWVLFLIQTLSINQLIFMLGKTFISSAIAISIVLMFEFFFSKKARQ